MIKNKMGLITLKILYIEYLKVKHDNSTKNREGNHKYIALLFLYQNVKLMSHDSLENPMDGGAW